MDDFRRLTEVEAGGPYPDLDDLPPVEVVIYFAKRGPGRDPRTALYYLELCPHSADAPASRDHALIYQGHSPYVERTLGLLGIKTGYGATFYPPILARLGRREGLLVLQ